MTVRVATRASALATAQSGWVAERIAGVLDRPVELITVSTLGDESDAPLDSFGSVGVFVSAVRQAVIDGRAEVAVHSLKDLPTAPESRLRVAAVPTREDPRDALHTATGMTLADLPEGARVGTGSPRRTAFLRAARPDLLIQAIRGNVDTRMGRVAAGDLDAVVLAAAGLIRLGRLGEETTPIDPAQVLPAPGQGALAIECRADLADTDLLSALAVLDDADTRAAVAAERQLLSSLEAGCTAPVGALARIEESEVHLQAAAAAIDGGRVLRLSESGPVDRAAEVGETLARRLLAAGAAHLMGERVP